jgi:hypothetical protein
LKKEYSLVGVVFAVVIFILYSCNNNDKRIANDLYKQREYLLQEFENKSLIGRGRNFYQLSYYKDQLVNSFYFQKKDTSIVLLNDTLQYPLNQIDAFTTVNIDSSNYREFVSNELRKLLRIMSDFKIDYVSSENATLGVDMKVYFGDFKALLYVRNIAAVKNERWKNYIRSGKKFDEHWFYVEDELAK